MDFWV